MAASAKSKNTPKKPAAKKPTAKAPATPKKVTRKKKELLLYQAVTQSYKLRQILHAMQPKAIKTLCGRAIDKGSHMEFDPEMERVCAKCVQSIDLMNRAHPGWE